jgi:hypothetical protein
MALFLARGLSSLARTLALLPGLLAAEPEALFPDLAPCRALTCLRRVLLELFDLGLAMAYARMLF